MPEDCRERLYFLDLSLNHWFVIVEIVRTKLSHFKVIGFGKIVEFCVLACNMDQACWSIKSSVAGQDCRV